MKKALGLIETIGLVTAIEAADAAVKSANVTLVGYENTRGGGKITVKVVGDVGAVQAAVAAGVAAAERIGKVYGHRIIPRPSDELDALIASVARGQKPAPAPAPLATPVPEPVAAPAVVVAPVVEPEPEPEVVEEAPEPEAAEEGEPEPPTTEPPASAPVNPTRGKSKPRGGKRR
jgi:ethanolamine utilization protein EutM